MELEQLRHFQKLAATGSFTRTAEQIGLSQSALSRSIARLEAELGQPLLERQSRKVMLNDAGRLLLDRAGKILLLADDAKAEISDDGETGRIRVAAIPTIAPFLLPEVLRAFQRQFPRAQVLVQEDTTANLLKKIAEGEVDVVVAALPIAGKYVDVEILFEEELLLVTSQDHPLASQETVEIADIEHLPFVLLGEAHCLSDNVVAFCRQESFQPVAVERTSQLATVQELVALGHGVSLVPAMARVRDASRTRVYRSLTGQRPSRTIVMVSNPYRFQRALVRHFREHLKSTAATGCDVAG